MLRAISRSCGQFDLFALPTKTCTVCTMAESSQKIKLQSSDNTTFEVSLDVASMSTTLKNMFDGMFYPATCRHTTT